MPIHYVVAEEGRPDVWSYRPILNLSDMSKLLERLVAKQPVDDLTSPGLLLALQSPYRAHHSTQWLKVLSDILKAIDAGNQAVLHRSLIFQRRSIPSTMRRFCSVWRRHNGLDGTVLKWISSYLKDCTQFVRSGASTSTPRRITCGVPQGPVLGPIPLLLYTADLQRIVEAHRLLPTSPIHDDDIRRFAAHASRRSIPEAYICICRWRCYLGAIKPALVKFCEDGGPEVASNSALWYPDCMHGWRRAVCVCT